MGHIFDAFLSLPILLIAIIISTLMEPSLWNAMFATLFAILPYFIHAIYRAIQEELKKDYVIMLKLEGISNWTLLKTTILPNITIVYIQEISRAFIVACTRYQRTKFYISWRSTSYTRMGSDDQRFT